MTSNNQIYRRINGTNVYTACLFQININGKHPLVMKNEEGKEANQKWENILNE